MDIQDSPNRVTACKWLIYSLPFLPRLSLHDPIPMLSPLLRDESGISCFGDGNDAVTQL